MANWSLSVQEAAAAMEGKLEFVGSGGLQDLVFTGVGTDSRVDLAGQLFFALVGDVHDAHTHLVQAVEKGATGLVVHRDLSESERAKIADLVKAKGFPVAIVHVADTLKGLQELSRHWRRKSTAMILGITGTNGKTTTKEFAAAIIGSRLRVQYSKGSFNNHWGVPISLLSIAPEHEVAIIEMGMNHLGELKSLSRLVEADAVVCTMVGRGHLEGVGSVDGVAAAKAEIYEFAPPRSTFVFNLDNVHTKKMREKFAVEGRRRLGFSADTEGAIGSDGAMADVAMKVVAMTPESIEVEGVIKGVSGRAVVPVFGAQNATNLMAASCLALAAGLSPQDIWAALPLCRSAWGRNQWVQLKSGARVLFDGYNANPESMAAALENARLLKESFKGRKIAVLGEMRELGEHAAALHEEVGVLTAQAGFDEAIFIGPSHEFFTRGLRVDAEAAGGMRDGLLRALKASLSFEESIAKDLSSRLKPGDFVLIKGSRGMSLENFLKALEPVDFGAKK
jgi:UDP-N-acetylmuramoyl-tripeptide--D-alanyl-D-alanine ligase